MLGALVLVAGLFFADSIGVVLRLLPPSVLGVILAVGGLELAVGTASGGGDRGDRYVMVLTAGPSIWNMGVGYAAGLALWHAHRRGWLRA
ncbi:MAG: hypothetical protein HYR86_10295 [Candidatus Rokubacteria bacterium]|nr:hypothetical protein [Candidatus Rokubacteria bacterium]